MKKHNEVKEIKIEGLDFVQIRKTAKQGYKLWLGLSYWFTASFIILIGWIAADGVFAIVMFILCLIGWVGINKAINYFLKMKGDNQHE